MTKEKIKKTYIIVPEYFGECEVILEEFSGELKDGEQILSLIPGGDA